MRVVTLALAILFVVGCAAPTPPAIEQPTPVAPEARPTPRPTPPPPATPALTRGQANAIASAESYLRFMAFSRSGLIRQLEFEGYSNADATFAVDSLKVNWTEQAYLSAKSYLQSMTFSLDGLIKQLEFEGFSRSDAVAGATRAYNE